MDSPVVISTNTTTGPIPLSPQWNKVSVSYAAAAVGTLVFKYRRRSTGTDETITLPSGATSATGNVSFDVSGPGSLYVVSTGVTGNLTLEVDKIES